MSGPRDKESIIVGGLPRADLLPGELKAEKAARSQRRSLVVLVILVAALVGVVYVGLGALQVASEGTLQAAQAKSATLLAEQAKYIEVQSLAGQITGIDKATSVASASDIDWLTYWNLIGATLPPGTVIAEVSARAGTLIAPFEAPSTLLQQQSVAEINLTATSLSQEDIAAWNDNLSTLPGFADSTITSVIYANGYFTTIITMHVNTGAYWNRAAESTTDEATAPVSDAETTPTTQDGSPTGTTDQAGVNN